MTTSSHLPQSHRCRMIASGPLVSVLTPSLNQGRWLEDNLRSVACQTYPRLEHIVMDGGSSDRSVALLRDAGPRVRWRSEPDNGQSHALNKAFALSQGEVIGWINSDDAYFDPHVVEDVVRFFAGNPTIDVVYGHVAYVDVLGHVLLYLWAPPFNRDLLRVYDFIQQPAAFFRRTALDGHLADETFGFAMDYELWLRLSADRTIVRLDRVIAIDRMHPQRKSRTALGLLAIDRPKLIEIYDLKTSLPARLLASLHPIYCRWRGVGLALTRHGELAFTGDEDRPPAVVWRQLARRKSRLHPRPRV